MGDYSLFFDYKAKENEKERERELPWKKVHTPSVAKMTNWSLLVMFLWVTSGTEMSPNSLTQ